MGDAAEVTDALKRHVAYTLGEDPDAEFGR